MSLRARRPTHEMGAGGIGRGLKWGLEPHITTGIAKREEAAPTTPAGPAGSECQPFGSTITVTSGAMPA